MKEVYTFVDLANMFHPTIKFTCEMSSELAVFLGIEVFKGPRLSAHKGLDLSPFKPQKGEALRLLRTNSVTENFEQSKRDFEHRPCQRGYPLKLVQEILTEVTFTNGKEALRNKTKQTRDFTVCYYLQSGHTQSQKDCHETLAHHFNNNLSLNKYLTSHRLSLTGRKNLLRTF